MRFTSPTLQGYRYHQNDRNNGKEHHHQRCKMTKALIAFFLGLFSFLLFMSIGDISLYYLGNVGLAATFILMGAHFSICQSFLSRGNPAAFLKDWPIMLALDAVFLLVLIPMVLSERLEVVLVQGLGILLFCCGGTLGGAFAASKAARRKVVRE